MMGWVFITGGCSSKPLLPKSKQFFTTFTYSFLPPLNAERLILAVQLLLLRKGIRNFTDCLVGDDCCHLILTSISVTAQSDNIHGEEGHYHTPWLDYELNMRTHQCITEISVFPFNLTSPFISSQINLILPGKFLNISALIFPDF